MTAHTPGPWRIGEYDRVVDTRGQIIRLTGVSLATGCVPADDECYANARLVAAAPELLAELKQLRANIEAEGWELAESPAIAKAEGRA